MRRTLSRKPFLKTDGKYLSREQAHDRARLRDAECHKTGKGGASGTKRDLLQR